MVPLYFSSFKHENTWFCENVSNKIFISSVSTHHLTVSSLAFQKSAELQKTKVEIESVTVTFMVLHQFTFGDVVPRCRWRLVPQVVGTKVQIVFKSFQRRQNAEGHVGEI